MAHRIREPMRHDGLGGMFTGRVIADETYIGGKPSNRHGHQPGQGGQGRTDKTPVLSLVSRETGEVRSKVIPDVTGATLRKAIAEQVDLAATESPHGRREVIRFDRARVRQSPVGQPRGPRVGSR